MRVNLASSNSSSTPLGIDKPIIINSLVPRAASSFCSAPSFAQMAMMFVRCRGGVSHSPLEFVHPSDVAAATAALAEYLWAKLL